MQYYLIYDGHCNLCATFAQLLEQFDRGQLFSYIPMQDRETLAQFGITEQDCEMGMILVSADSPDQRWQGSAAAEEISRLLPLGQAFVAAYRAIPGMKWMGDRTYERVRDHRYAWFGKRESVYQSAYPFKCVRAASPQENRSAPTCQTDANPESALIG
jgi:predicted DCC family thiol-disulfide oxidoreductase YuxK